MAEVDHFLFSLSLHHKVINICQNRYKKLVSNPSSLTTVTHTATSSTVPSPTFRDSFFFPTGCGAFSKQNCYLTPVGEEAGALETGHLSVSFLQ